MVHAGLRAGESVYVGGGAGHVGSAAVLLAARAGARVVASASAADLDHCRDLGADVALDYRANDFADRLRDAGEFDVHLDTSGRLDLVSAVGVLAPRGRNVVMAGRSSRPELPAGQLYTKDGRLLGFVISNARVSELSAAACRTNQLLAPAALMPRRVETMPLSAMAQAHTRLEEGRARGVRLVLLP
jgi:NADPH:quinone reductase-like Zn-dependent oxidoreductase